MEPPSEFQSPRRDPWEGAHRKHQPSFNYSRQQQQQHNDEYQPPQDHQQAACNYNGSREQIASSSRGRSSTSRYSQPAAVTPPVKNGDHNRHPSSHSNSNTPRRKGNPQSSSPSLDHRSPHRPQQQQQQQQHQTSSTSLSPNESRTSSIGSSINGNPLTPLTTLSTILTTHALHSQTSLQLYRQSHALHRHASDRTHLALEKLRSAQAELEHSQTAQEFAKEELDSSQLQKVAARDALAGICKRTRSLSKPLVNKRVRLVGLSRNAMWNGRLGTIVKLVLEGEDCGRWKVELDGRWRGRDAEGRVVDAHHDHHHDHHHDKEERPPRQVGADASAVNVVVAKAENLELVEEDINDCLIGNDENLGELFGGEHPTAAAVGGSKQQRSANSRSASRSRSANSNQQQEYQVHQQQQQKMQPHGELQHQSSRVERQQSLSRNVDPQQDDYFRRSNSRDPQQDFKSPQRRSQRDPSITRKTNDPVATVTPESRGSRGSSRGSSDKNSIAPVNYVKSESGQYHESSADYPQSDQRRSGPQHAQQHQSQHQQQQQQRNGSPSKQARHASPTKMQHQVRQVSPSKQTRQSSTSPSKKSQRGRQQQQQQQQMGQSQGPIFKSRQYTSASESAPSKYSTPIRRSPSNDSARLSSAFSRMLLSPVSFTPVSFHPDPSESFQRWANDDDQDDNGHQIQNQQQQQQQTHHIRQSKPIRRGGGSWSSKQRSSQPSHNNGGGGGQHDGRWDGTSVAGSLFDEVTSLEKKDGFPTYNDEDYDDDDEIHNGNNDHEWVDHIRHRHCAASPGDPQLQPYPSQDDCNTTVTTAVTGGQHHHNSLPNVVILPVPEDDADNPYLSPGYSSNSPPHCVGVQNAGVSHVNGVYVLAYPKDENGNPIMDGNDNNTPPLYFKDGPPALLSDNRQYDMCILRINCPDSADHVIWFLARVDVDPSCLDVKFSDCYYYCRMLRNDDGCGGEAENGTHVPPCRGWNVPKLPPGVEMLRIAKCGSFSTTNGGGGGGDYTHTTHQTMDTNLTSNADGQYAGLGIAARPKMVVHQREEEEEQGEDEDFVSPGMDSSKYSI